jgi:hypothetical protein|tara:strand:- start:976 stop:1605 length:630 start_codon:yes stop_codon:yes gene_type:complete
MFGKNKINKMGIQDSIRRNIQILQEEKKVSLTEEKIVKGRFSMVPKNINKHSTIQNNKTFNVLFNEVRTLKSHGINQKVINENMVQVLSQMFDEEGPRFLDIVKEKLAEYLKSKLQLTDIEQEIIVSAIGNTEMDEVSELFNDPRFLAQKIAQAYSEDMGSKYSMVSTDNSDMVKKLEDTFVDKLKPVIGDVNSNMELKLKDIRDNMLS